MAKKSLAEGVFSVQRPQFLTKITLLFCQAFLQLRVNNGHLQFYQNTVSTYHCDMLIVTSVFKRPLKQNS